LRGGWAGVSGWELGLVGGRAIWGEGGLMRGLVDERAGRREDLMRGLFDERFVWLCLCLAT